jgi:hypothetical protein
VTVGILMRRARTEQAIQQAIFQHIQVRGVRGLVAVHDAKVYALEIKAPGGRPTASQLEFIADMEAAGAHCCIAEGLDRALAVLEQWGILRGHRQ